MALHDRRCRDDQGPPRRRVRQAGDRPSSSTRSWHEPRREQQPTAGTVGAETGARTVAASERPTVSQRLGRLGCRPCVRAATDLRGRLFRRHRLGRRRLLRGAVFFCAVRCAAFGVLPDVDAVFRRRRFLRRAPCLAPSPGRRVFDGLLDRLLRAGACLRLRRASPRLLDRGSSRRAFCCASAALRPRLLAAPSSRPSAVSPRRVFVALALRRRLLRGALLRAAPSSTALRFAGAFFAARFFAGAFFAGALLRALRFVRRLLRGALLRRRLLRGALLRRRGLRRRSCASSPCASPGAVFAAGARRRGAAVVAGGAVAQSARRRRARASAPAAQASGAGGVRARRRRERRLPRARRSRRRSRSRRLTAERRVRRPTRGHASLPSHRTRGRASNMVRHETSHSVTASTVAQQGDARKTAPETTVVYVDDASDRDERVSGRFRRTTGRSRSCAPRSGC